MINRDAFKSAGRPRTAREIAQQMLEGKSYEEMLALAGAVAATAVKDILPESEIPTDKDGLWNYIKDTWGIELARVAVCPGHSAPFDFIWMGYAEVVPNLFLIASRGAGKSFMTAMLLALNSRGKPNCESIVFGAVDDQNKKVYNDFVQYFLDKGLQDGVRETAEDPTMSLTKLTNGSVAKSLPGTMAKLNGPHPCSPGDELILTFDGYKPISELDPGRDRLASYFKTNKLLTWGTIQGKIKRGSHSEIGISFHKGMQRWIFQIPDGRGGRKQEATFATEEEAAEAARQYRLDNPKIAFPFEMSKRPYSGNLIVIESESGRTRVTPNHVVRIKFDPSQFKDKWAVYLMRKGDWWRIGTTSLGRVIRRMNEERADAVWIITVFPDRLAALEYEMTAQAEYGITGVVFEPSTSNATLKNPQNVHRSLEENAFSRAVVLLAKHDMHPDTPLCWKTTIGSETTRRFISSVWFDTAAGNVAPLSECVMVPGVPESFVDGGNMEHPGHSLATVTKDIYSGYVYSIDVLPYHYYVSGGHVVHNSKAHSEEVELFREGPWKESRNLASDRIVGDTRIKAQNFGTSTRKYKNGRVDKIYKRFLKAKLDVLQNLGAGATEEELRERLTISSPWYCLCFCIFEVAAEVPNCRTAPENSHLPDEELCSCRHVQNGELDDGTPRTLESVCKGRLYRSRGHRSYGEIVQLFLQNDRGTWNAQQECSEADSEGLYIKSFSRARHGLQKFILNPANGPIFTGTDWGFTDEAAVLWVQYLDRAVAAESYNGGTKILPAGSRVILSEVYEAGKTATELGEKAIIREAKLAQHLSISRIPVRKRWADLQGAGDRRDWSKLGLRTSKYSSRSFDEHVKEVRGMFDVDRAFVVVDEDRFSGMGCPELCEQLEGWRQENGKEMRELPQHLCSGLRYVLFGMHDVYNDAGALVDPALKAAQSGAIRPATAPAARALKKDSPAQASEGWRERMGVGAGNS